MDHLPLPKDALTDEAPFLGSHYDETIPFLQYHQHSSLSSDLLLEKFVSTCIALPKLPPALIAWYAPQIHVPEEALQAWLFFGLLKEFLGKSYDHNEFHDEVHRILSTKKLVLRVDEWMERRTSSVNNKELKHMDKCIRIVYYAIWALWKPKYNLILKLSIASVAELLHGAVRKVGGDSPILEPLSWVWFWDENDTLNRLIRVNWCKYEASQVPKRLMSLSTRYFYTHLTRKNSGGVHSFCDGTTCRAASIQVEQQRDPRLGTPHRHSDCKCEEITVSEDAQILANEILKSGQFPIFQIRAGNGRISIGVTAYKDGIPFVAISHVFSDGLGNEEANAMKSCQLEHLKDLIMSLWREKSINEIKTDAWFWIDTFGCPRKDRAARDFAIMRLRATFEKASHVLVLDSELQALSCTGMNDLEISARLLNSGWMHRMWTLSESSISRSVWIQFADCVKNVIDDLATGVEVLFRAGSVQHLALAKDIISHLQGLRGLERDYKKLKVELFEISSSLEFRLTTKSRDEPLCIAMLVNLDLEALQLIKDELKRKELMWKLLARKYPIPRTIVFYHGDSLPLHGFQWAPQSLSTPGLRSFLMNAEDKKAKLETTVEPRGLHASFPGGRILMPLRNALDPNKLRYVQGQQINAFPIRLVSASTRWILLSREDNSSYGQSLLDLLQNRKGSLAIFRDPDNLSRGQLSEIEEIVDGVLVVKRLSNVSVMNHEDQWNALLEMVLREAGNLSQGAVMQRILSSSRSTDGNDDCSSENIEIAYTMLNEAIKDTATRMFASCGQTSPPENNLNFVCASLSGALVGRYGTIEEVTADGTLPEKNWCFV